MGNILIPLFWVLTLLPWITSFDRLHIPHKSAMIFLSVNLYSHFHSFAESKSQNLIWVISLRMQKLPCESTRLFCLTFGSVSCKWVFHPIKVHLRESLGIFQNWYIAISYHIYCKHCRVGKAKSGRGVPNLFSLEYVLRKGPDLSFWLDLLSVSPVKSAK